MPSPEKEVGAPDTPSIRIREYEPFPTFRKHVPRASDRHSETTVESQKHRAEQGPEERNFDILNYSADDHGFWDKFEELWKSPREGALDNSITPDPARRTTTSAHSRRKADHSATMDKAAVQRRLGWKIARPNVLHGQRNHLIQTCNPKDLPGALKTFRKWKKSLARCWEILSEGELPRKQAEIRILRWLLGHGEVATMKDAWKALPQDRRRRIWPNVMISALQSHPEKAQLVFGATFDASLVPSYMAQDVIHYLVRQHGASGLASLHMSSPGEIYRMVRVVLEDSPPEYLRLRQRTLYLLIRELPTSAELADLYHVLVEHKHQLHHFTQLHIASRLARDVPYKSPSVDILQSALRTTKLDINTPQGASLCTSILSLKEEDVAGESVSVTPAELLERLLECGLKPNLITYTALIRNLCLTGDLGTAWEVFRLLTKQGIKADTHVYSILWNASKLRQDFTSLRQVVDQMIMAKTTHHSPVLWTDLLHGIFLSALLEARGRRTRYTRVVPSFPLMLQAYAKLFATDPLRTVLPDIDGILVAANQQRASGSPDWRFYSHFGPIVQALPQLAPSDPMQPLAETLAVMLIGYVRAVSAPYDVMAFYSNFRKLLREGNPVVAGLVRDQGTLVHDIVIKRLCEWPGMLRVALDVASDMLKDAAAVTEDKTPRHPAPSVYTWSILLGGFMRHRESEQAEKILRMMRSRGVMPNAVTWNTLVAGYARLQNVRETVGAMQRLEHAGLAANDFTFKAFGYLHNKTAALNQMEAMIEEKRRRLKEKESNLRKQQEELGGEEGELQRLVSEVEEIAKSMNGERGEGAEASFDEDDDVLEEMADEREA